MKSSASEPGLSIVECREDGWAPTLFFDQSEVCGKEKKLFSRPLHLISCLKQASLFTNFTLIKSLSGCCSNKEW